MHQIWQLLPKEIILFYFTASKRNTQEDVRGSISKPFSVILISILDCLFLCFRQQRRCWLRLKSSKCPCAVPKSLNCKRKRAVILSTLANDTSTLFLEWILFFWDAFDQGILIHTTLNVFHDLFTTFRHLPKKIWSSSEKVLVCNNEIKWHRIAYTIF